MKKVLSLILALALLLGVGITSTVTASAAIDYNKVFSDAFNELSWMYYGEDYFFTEKEGPKAVFVDEFICHTCELDKYAPIDEDGFEMGQYPVSAAKYEKVAFKYFKKTDKLVKRLHKLPTYDNGVYTYTIGGWGGPTVDFRYQKYRSLGDGKYEVYSFICDTYEYYDTVYIPSKNEVENEDYLIYSYGFDPDAKVCGKIIGGIKSVVSYNGKSVPKYLSIEKVSKKQILKLVNPTVEKVKLSTTSYTYNGKKRTPTVKAYDSNGDKISSKYYDVKYASGRKNVGKYKVTVTFKGKYSGKKTVYFKINPKKTSVSKVTAAKNSLKLKIKKQSKQVTGYEIQYSTSKKFKAKYTKTKTVKSYKTTSVTLKSLKAKKTYYVRVRTYKKVDGKKYYSAWSSAKSKKTK